MTTCWAYPTLPANSTSLQADPRFSMDISVLHHRINDIDMYVSTMRALNFLAWTDNYDGQQAPTDWSFRTVVCHVDGSPPRPSARMNIRLLIMGIFQAVHFYHTQHQVLEGIFTVKYDRIPHATIFISGLLAPQNNSTGEYFDMLKASNVSNAQSASLAPIYVTRTPSNPSMIGDDESESSHMNTTTTSDAPYTSIERINDDFAISDLPIESSTLLTRAPGNAVNIEINVDFNTRRPLRYQDMFYLIAGTYQYLAADGKQRRTEDTEITPEDSVLSLRFVPTLPRPGESFLRNVHVLRALIRIVDVMVSRQQYYKLRAGITLVKDGQRTDLGRVDIYRHVGSDNLGLSAQ